MKSVEITLNKLTCKLITRSNFVKREGLQCWYCGKEIPLKSGIRIISRGSSGHKKYYHISCAKKVSLI